MKKESIRSTKAVIKATIARIKAEERFETREEMKARVLAAFVDRIFTMPPTEKEKAKLKKDFKWN